jgi:hypothetical protein
MFFLDNSVLDSGDFSRILQARICKRLKSPEIDSKESIPPAYLAWWAGSANRVVVPARQAGNRFLGFLKGLQIRALLTNFTKLCSVYCTVKYVGCAQILVTYV